MRTRISFLSFLALLLPFGSSAQSEGAYFDGKLLSMPYYSSADIFAMSNQSYSFGTARSAAMGGAFASLGADMSAMHINPAGLGMYTGSEFSFSPSIIHTKSESRYPGAFTGDNTKSRFTIGNIGTALNVYQGSRALTSVTVGISYNRMADFNTTGGVTIGDMNFSIADAFAMQLNNSGISPSSLESNYNSYRDNAPLYWGSIMAYRSGLLGHDSENDVYGVFSNMIGNDALMDHTLLSRTKGHLGEFALSAGFNFTNKLYLGFTLGIQDLYYKQSEEYTEDMLRNSGDLNILGYDQYVRYSGTGVNFKFGVIYRPIPALRIGVAVHTPTFMDVNRQYRGELSYDAEGVRPTRYGSPTFESYPDLDFMTPTRLMTGVSYSFGNIALVSVDYECVWYNGMRSYGYDVIGFNDYYYWDKSRDPEFTREVKEHYAPAHNFRAGLEFRPLPSLFLRGGYSNSGQALKRRHRDTMFPMPVEYRTENISAGIGYRLGRFSADFTYVNSKSDMTPYDFMYAIDDYDELVYDFEVDTKRTRNNFILTLGFRF